MIMLQYLYERKIFTGYPVVKSDFGNIEDVMIMSIMTTRSDPVIAQSSRMLNR